jgi:hypothetical protein
MSNIALVSPATGTATFSITTPSGTSTDRTLTLPDNSGTVANSGISGVDSVPVGRGAGNVATNTAVGASALAANEAGGNNNTAVGYESLNANTTGDFNTAVGSGALDANTTASNNTAVGYQALYANTTAVDNVAVGYTAGSTQTTAKANCFIGTAAGGGVTTGSFNTFVGSGEIGVTAGAGEFMTTGSKNTIIGRYSGNQGGLDIRTLSNRIVLSDGDGNPQANQIDGQWYFGMGTKAADGLVSFVAQQGTNQGPVLVGRTGALNALTTRWYIGSDSWVKGGTDYDSVTIASGSAASGGVKLTSGATSWVSASDARLKTVTGGYDNALADIAQIQAVKFTWKHDADNKPCVGVIAQSVEAVVPEAVDRVRNSKEDETQYLGVRYTELIPLMIASIQELKAEFDAYKASHP